MAELGSFEEQLAAQEANVVPWQLQNGGRPARTPGAPNESRRIPTASQRLEALEKIT